MIVDDESDVRAGVRDILASSSACRVVAEAGDGRECLRRLDSAIVDVVVLDVRMPVMDGLATLRSIRLRWPATRVLLLTTFSDTDYVRDAVESSADGFLLKSGDPRELIAAVTSPPGEGPYFSPSVVGVLADDLRRTATRREQSRAARHRLDSLAPREHDVAEHVARGRTNSEIADILFLGESTVKSYLATALRRLGLRNRVELAALVWESDTHVDPE
ncbi:MAG: response regulator transcription factor [Gordonia paraffinivorans]